jgi:pSer/pThr/pTyr-binding forkhead associated (FHA) protein
MRRENEDKVDPHKPALIVIFGNTRKRCRPLDRDVFVLGRAPGCDLGLVSPEVASVHCVIIRFPNGWRIRDCSGRGATRVNGRSVHDGPLYHGDVIQVGSFSFEAHLPDQPVPPEGLPKTPSAREMAERNKLLRSRRNLVRHALRMRGRLREADTAQQELQRRREDLERQEERLRARIREQEARIAHRQEELEQREVALAARAETPRANLEQSTALRPVAEGMRNGALAVPGTGSTTSEVMRRLEIRARELDQYAEHLRRQGSRQGTVTPGAVEKSPELAELRDELHERNEEVLALRERLAQHEAFLREDQANYETDLHRFRLELERDRQVMEEQCLALARRQEDMDRQQAELQELQARLQEQQARLQEQQAETHKQQSQPLRGELGQRLEAVRKLRQSLAEMHSGRTDGPRKPDSVARTPDSQVNHKRTGPSDSDGR